ncbi:hypothetical protein BaRGS_00007245, partial [Batillaria attramentaria]
MLGVKTRGFIAGGDHSHQLYVLESNLTPLICERGSCNYGVWVWMLRVQCKVVCIVCTFRDERRGILL